MIKILVYWFLTVDNMEEEAKLIEDDRRTILGVLNKCKCWCTSNTIPMQTGSYAFWMGSHKGLIGTCDYCLRIRRCHWDRPTLLLMLSLRSSVLEQGLQSTMLGLTFQICPQKQDGEGSSSWRSPLKLANSSSGLEWQRLDLLSFWVAKSKSQENVFSYKLAL